MIEFRKNFAWFRANTCDVHVVCIGGFREGAEGAVGPSFFLVSKHFHTSLLGNEEDAKGLLNIKQEFLSHHLLHLIVASGFT